MTGGRDATEAAASEDARTEEPRIEVRGVHEVSQPPALRRAPPAAVLPWARDPCAVHGPGSELTGRSVLFTSEYVYAYALTRLRRARRRTKDVKIQ